MFTRRSFIHSAAIVVATGMLALPLGASAQTQEKTGRYTAEDIAKAKPVATFDFSAEQLRLIVGGSSGKGVLHYQGKQYPFTAKGVSVGGVGYTKVNATGDVYFMKTVDDFAGIYSAASLGAAAGAGAGVSQFENNKGVFLKVKSKTEGLALNLGLGGVQIDLAK
jgi:hypothetical protein